MNKRMLRQNWIENDEYQSLNDPQIEQDLSTVDSLISELSNACKDIGKEKPIKDFHLLDRVFENYANATRLMSQIKTYCGCRLSVDSLNEQANEVESLALQRLYKLKSCWTVIEIALVAASAIELNEYFHSSGERLAKKHYVEKIRNFKWYLPVEQEQLISSLSNYGLKSWSRLYTKMKGKMFVEEEGKKTTFAAAVSNKFSNDPLLREKSQLQINQMASESSDICIDILNSMIGWRLEVLNQRNAFYERQATPKSPNFSKMTYLDYALTASDTTQATLDSLISSTQDARNKIQKVLGIKEKYLNLDPIKSHQIHAPLPVETLVKGADAIKYSYEQALAIISEAVGSIHPSMGDFVYMMAEKGWIEAGNTGNRRAGAFCTGFPKSKTPRVYMTFNGSAKDLITLAHELGHAYHGWLLREQDLFEKSYPMTLAETASVFFETAVKDSLIQTGDFALKASMLWQDLTSLLMFLADIPCRYELERYIYEAKAIEPLKAESLYQKTTELQNKWFGEGRGGANGFIWITTLHYYIAELPFYNFPYTFGYLFANYITEQGKNQKDFYQQYNEVLRDTGRMSAAQLIKKHFNKDIEQKAFWAESIEIVCRKIDEFNKLDLYFQT